MAKLIKIGMILILLLGCIWGIKEVALKINYPRKYEEHVEQYAKENELDPLLVYAIIKAESNFKPDVVSSSKAIGLMQLLESTAKEKAEKEEIPFESAADLYDPQKNIQLGCAYFAELLENYDGNLALAIAAYNAGIGKVNAWIREGTIQKDGSDIENIPYKETNTYVRKIIRDYDIYQKIYPKEN